MIYLFGAIYLAGVMAAIALILHLLFFPGKPPKKKREAELKRLLKEWLEEKS